MSASTTRDEVKSALSDPHALCQALGVLEGSKRQANGLLICCPAHGEKNASCSVTVANGTIRVKCFACDLSGDAFSLIGAVHGLDVSRDFQRILDLAAELAGIDGSSRTSHTRPPLHTVPPPEPIVDRTEEWNALPPLDEDCWEYLRGRGLDAAADLCRSPNAESPGDYGKFSAAGYRLAVALRDGKGRVVGVQLRRIAPSPHGGDKDDRFLVVGQSGAGVFGDPTAVAKHKYVVLCEGMTDTLAATVGLAGVDAAVIGIAGVKATAGLYSLPLRERRVVIATDADAKGDEAAAAIAGEVLKRGGLPSRARPTGAKDLADMLLAGRDLRDFFRTAMTGFQSVITSASLERAERQAMKGHFLSLGVGFLDDAMGGIFPDDLILLGAATGKGKTEMATGIARANVLAGKAVHYIALEAGRHELTRRIKYPIISQLVYDDRGRVGDLWRRLNYLDWFMGRLDSWLDPYERIADQQIREKYPTLFVRYKASERFDKDTLRQAVLDVAGETDLLIIDHLHYVDSDDPNENRGLKAIVSTVRDLQPKTNKPTLLVCHIRKADRARKKPQLVPSIEDIHGSSDPGKISTKVIVIAPAYDQPSDPDHPNLAPTYIEPSKCRADGSRTRFVGLVSFNFRTGRYEKAYELGHLSDDRSKFIFAKREKLPTWATDQCLNS